MAAPSAGSGMSENEIQRKLTSLAEGDSVQLTSLPHEIQQFLEIHPSLNFIGSGKVRCGQTGHEMPCKMAAMESYTKGRKYRRLQEHSSYDWEEYKPHIVSSKKKGRRHQLFCKLTMRHISREPVDIARHTKGRKYTRALARYNDCQRLGVPFKPLCRIPRKDRPEHYLDQGPSRRNSTDSEASEGESEDSMSDLYPGVDFEGELEGKRLQDDIENMDIDSANKNTKGVTSVGTKRKNLDASKKNTTKKSTKQASHPTQPKKLKDTR